jgi:4-hydroxy-tetrahydrodipicolinate synthase
MTDLQLRGIIPATVTPFMPDGSLDEQGLRRYLTWLEEQDVHGVTVHADTGEANTLTPEERVKITGIAAEVLGGKIPVVACLFAQSTAEAVELGQRHREAGADALMIFPPMAFYGTPLPPEIPEAYYGTIADEVGLPLVAFQLLSALGGVEYTPEALRRILLIDSVIAIKEATFDALKFRSTMKLVRSLPREIFFLSGNDNFIYESLVLGADGCLIGFGTLACREQVRMYEAVQIRDFAQAERIAEQLRQLNEAVFASPVRNYRARTKEVLATQGVIEHAGVRPPLPPLAPEEVEAVRNGLSAAGLVTEERV